MKNNIKVIADGKLYEYPIVCPQCGEQFPWQHSDNLYYSEHLFFTTCKTYRVYGCRSCGCQFEVYDNTRTKFKIIEIAVIAVFALIIILHVLVYMR